MKQNKEQIKHSNQYTYANMLAIHLSNQQITATTVAMDGMVREIEITGICPSIFDEGWLFDAAEVYESLTNILREHPHFSFGLALDQPWWMLWEKETNIPVHCFALYEPTKENVMQHLQALLSSQSFATISSSLVLGSFDAWAIGQYFKQIPTMQETITTTLALFDENNKYSDQPMSLQFESIKVELCATDRKQSSTSNQNSVPVILSDVAILLGQGCLESDMVSLIMDINQRILIKTTNRIDQGRVLWATDQEIAYGMDASVDGTKYQGLLVANRIKALGELDCFVRGMLNPLAPQEVLIKSSEEEERLSHAIHSLALELKEAVSELQQRLPKENKIHIIRVSGEMAGNDLFLQLCANLMGLRIERPMEHHLIPMGIASLLAKQQGIWNKETIASHWQLDMDYDPQPNWQQAEEMQLLATAMVL